MSWIMRRVWIGSVSGACPKLATKSQDNSSTLWKCSTKLLPCTFNVVALGFNRDISQAWQQKGAFFLRGGIGENLSLN